VLPRPSEQVSVKVLNNQTQLAIPDAHIVIQDPDTEDVLHRSVDTLFPSRPLYTPPLPSASARFARLGLRCAAPRCRKSCLRVLLVLWQAPPRRLPRVVDGLPRVVTEAADVRDGHVAGSGLSDGDGVASIVAKEGMYDVTVSFLRPTPQP
jgi:hypothetical protein